jgi:hypothetical protein
MNNYRGGGDLVGGCTVDAASICAGVVKKPKRTRAQLPLMACIAG